MKLEILIVHGTDLSVVLILMIVHVQKLYLVMDLLPLFMIGSSSMTLTEMVLLMVKILLNKDS